MSGETGAALKLSYAQWVALDYMLQPGARFSRSYGSSHVVWRPKGKLDQVLRVHEATFGFLLRNGLIEKDVMKSAERTWYTSYYRITAKGRAAHDAGKPSPSVARERLTKFQADVFKNALADKEEPGVIRQRFMREATRDFLLDNGYIQQRLRFDTAAKTKERDQAIARAKSSLGRDDAIKEGHWMTALTYLRRASDLDDDVAEVAYFITEKGRKAVEG